MTNIKNILALIEESYEYKILEDENTNVECDLCGKDLWDCKSYILCLCDNEKQYESWKDDPMSGEIFIFGSECLKQVKKALKEIK